MRLEQLREYLIHGGIKGVNALVELIPGIDRNKLRTLVKRAHDELSSTIPDRPAARALYQFIKAEVNRAQVEIPDSMLRAKPKFSGKAKAKAESEQPVSQLLAGGSVLQIPGRKDAAEDDEDLDAEFDEELDE